MFKGLNFLGKEGKSVEIDPPGPGHSARLLPQIRRFPLKFFKTVPLRAIIFLSATTFLAPSLSLGAMLDTRAALETQDARAKVLAQLERAEVVEYLAGQGLSQAEAESRINSLTDDEINSLAHDIDQYAGGALDDGDDAKAMIGVLIGAVILVCLTLCLIILL